MENKELIKELSKLSYDEQLKAYSRENPESYLLEKSIEEKKEQIRNSNYLKK